MQEGEMVIMRVFSGILPRFGTHHARVMWQALSTEAKTAQEISKRTGIGLCHTYRTLKGLAAWGIVKASNSSPAFYFVDSPKKMADRIITKFEHEQMKIMNERREMFDKLIDNASSQSGEEYLIRIDGGQTRLINKKTRQAILDEFVVRDLRRKLDTVLLDINNTKNGQVVKYG